MLSFVESEVPSDALSLDAVLLLDVELLFDDAELPLPDEAAVVSSVAGCNVVSGMSSQIHFFSHLQSLLISFSGVSLVLFVPVLFDEVLLLFADVSVDLFLLLQSSVLHALVSIFSVQSSPPLVLVRVLFCSPPPQFSEHAPQSVHSSHSQESVKNQ